MDVATVGVAIDRWPQPTTGNGGVSALTWCYADVEAQAARRLAAADALASSAPQPGTAVGGACVVEAALDMDAGTRHLLLLYEQRVGGDVQRRVGAQQQAARVEHEHLDVGVVRVDRQRRHELGRIAQTVDELGVGFGKVAMPLRVAVTGGAPSPDLDLTISLVGREATLRRIDRAVSYIRSKG